MDTNTTVYRRELHGKILETALEHFKQNGIKAVKMDDIALIMGISKRTLYELFGCKEDLLMACVQRHESNFDMHVEELLDNDRDDVIYIMVEILFYNMRFIHNINPKFLSELVKYPAIDGFLKQKYEHRKRLYKHLIKEGIKQGYFKKDINYELLVLMHKVKMDYILRNQIFQKYPLEEIMKNVILVVIRGVCTSKGLKRFDEVLSF